MSFQISSGSALNLSWIYRSLKPAARFHGTSGFAAKCVFAVFASILLLPGCSRNVEDACASDEGDSRVCIVLIGDSITQGNVYHDSYRRALWHLFQSGGYSVNFVGSIDHNFGGMPPNPDFDLDHEGHWQWRADQILRKLPSWLASYTPDIALVHIGSNDVFQEQTVASTVREIEGIIDVLRDEGDGGNPDVAIFLAKLIPSDLDDMSQLNAEMESIAARKNTARSPVVVIDQSAGFEPASDTYDGIHPNAVGEEKMARKWYDALVPHLASSR